MTRVVLPVEVLLHAPRADGENESARGAMQQLDVYGVYVGNISKAIITYICPLWITSI